MAEAGRTRWGHPRPGGGEMPCAGKALLCTHAVGDNPTARPFPVPPDPPQMLGRPACPPYASPKPFQLEGPQLCQPRREVTHSSLSTPGQTESG